MLRRVFNLTLILAALVSACSGGAPGAQGTSTPSLEPTATPTPIDLEKITPENLNQIVQLGRAGSGTLTDIAASPDGKVLALSGSLGIWL